MGARYYESQIEDDEREDRALAKIEDTRGTVMKSGFTTAQLKGMAETMAQSGLFGIRDVRGALALMLLADADGLHPATVMRDYHIIEGKPALTADAMLRRFQASGGKVQWKSMTDLIAEGTFTAPDGTTLTLSWTVDKAKKAGVWNKNNWSKYPGAMLRARCATEAIRAIWPAVLGGMYTTPEVSGFAGPKGGSVDDPSLGDVVAEVCVDDDLLVVDPPKKTAKTTAKKPAGRSKAAPKKEEPDEDLAIDREIAESLTGAIDAAEDTATLDPLYRETESIVNDELKLAVQEHWRARLEDVQKAEKATAKENAAAKKLAKMAAETQEEPAEDESEEEEESPPDPGPSVQQDRIIEGKVKALMLRGQFYASAPDAWDKLIEETLQSNLDYQTLCAIRKEYEKRKPPKAPDLPDNWDNQG